MILHRACCVLAPFNIPDACLGYRQICDSNGRETFVNPDRVNHLPAKHHNESIAAYAIRISHRRDLPMTKNGTYTLMLSAR